MFSKLNDYSFLDSGNATLIFEEQMATVTIIGVAYLTAFVVVFCLVLFLFLLNCSYKKTENGFIDFSSNSSMEMVQMV